MVRRGSLALAAALMAASIATAQNAPPQQPQQQRPARPVLPDTPGSGPYPARMEIDATIPNHVIYRPADLNRLDGRKLGVIVWGNGGCTDDGASARLHLAELASHGYLVVASGKILTGPSAPAGSPASTPMTTNADDMRRGLDWALGENGRRGSAYYRRIDPRIVAVSGHSCGGILSLQLAPDPRIKAIILHNSGVFPNRPERPTLITDKAMLKGLRTPVLYVIGNETDVAWPIATDDFSKIDHVPVMLASLTTVGHGGTFGQPNGGIAARVALDWLDWQLHGNKQAAQTFRGASCRLCVDPAWKVQRKGL